MQAEAQAKYVTYIVELVNKMPVTAVRNHVEASREIWTHSFYVPLNGHSKNIP